MKIYCMLDDEGNLIEVNKYRQWDSDEELEVTKDQFMRMSLAIKEWEWTEDFFYKTLLEQNTHDRIQTRTL